MKPPTSPFQLGRMRHLDLLALYYELNPPWYGDWHGENRAARMSKEQLATMILVPIART